jgi:DNA-binding SARP family transcriptional activator
VEFRVLGPFEVRENGRTVDIGSPKHRVLLATLLLQPGRTVPVEALAEAIWDAGPPGNPRRVVQVYVARLRKLLASAALTRAAARAATDPGRPLHTVAAELPARRRGSNGARRPARLDSG